jgi:acyl transferase domain-containing protein/acyl carrier protein
VGDLVAWPAGASPRIAGISSFGISGTNAHVIVEEPPAQSIDASDRPAEPTRSDDHVLVTVSARDPETRLRASAQLGTWIRENPGVSIEDLARTTTRRRSHHVYRAAVVGRSAETLAEHLLANAGSAAQHDVITGKADVLGKTVFVFPGQGSQWLGMGRALLAEEPTFSAQMRACDAALRPYTGWSLLDALEGDLPAGGSLEAAFVIQPILFAIHISLAAVWRSWGIEPDAVVGHSQGEVAAAFLAGALDLDDAARLIALRSRLLSRIAGLGAMAFVGLSPEALAPWLSERSAHIELAAENGPDASVVSGDAGAIASLLSDLERAEVYSRRINVDIASHSRHVERLREDILRELAPIAPKRAALPIYSTVTSAVLEGPELDAAYWYENLRRPVRFAAAVSALVESGHRFFIESSAHPLLTQSISERLKQGDVSGAVVGTLRRDEGGRANMLRSLSALYVRGYPVAWERLYAGRAPSIDLPSYPFRRDRYWLPLAQIGAEAPAPLTHGGGHPLLGRAQAASSSPGVHIWEQTLSLRDLPYLADHVVAGVTLMPAAAFIEMAAAGARELWGRVAVTLEDVRFARACVLREEGARLRMTLTELGAGELELRIESAGDASSAAWTEHVRGRIRGSSEIGVASRAIEALGPKAERLDAAEVYATLGRMSLSYGEAFRGIEHLSREGELVDARVRLPAKAGRAAPYVVHPALLDACLQSLAVVSAASATEGPAVPVAVRAVHIKEALGDHARCLGRIAKDGSVHRGDLVITNNDGDVIVRVDGLTAEPLERRATEPLDDVLLDVRWIAKRAVAEPRSTPGRWLLLEDRGGVARALAERIRASGGDVDRIEPGEVDVHRPDAVRDALFARVTRGAPFAGIVCLWGLDTPALPSPEIFERGAGWAGVLHLVQALAGRAEQALPPLVLVTHSAAPHALRKPARPEQALLWGLAGAVRAEHPRLKIRTIDLGDPSDIDELTSLTAELKAADHEELIALRGASRDVARLVRPKATWLDARAAEMEAGDRAYRLDAGSSIEGLALHLCDRPPPAADEVELEIEAAGLNFLDVLSVVGGISRELGTAGSLGTECVGRVVRAGDEVRDIAVGDRVIAITGGCFGSHTRAPAALTFPCPDGLRADLAATLPMAHLTAYYSLHHVARLSAGERVLIHSAAGGVGQAALQWARHAKAEIYATAGSEEKRAFLRRQGVVHVSDSRSGRFVQDILEWTDGEGVDVALNALGGRRIQESLELLRDHGRFIELGKRDYIDDAPLRTRPFLRSLTFSLVDLRSLILKRRDLVRSLFREVLDHVKQGTLTPLPHRTFCIDEAREAFLEMAQGTHIGKLVATTSKRALIRAPRSSEGALFGKSGSYLVTGGLGGLGLSIAEWMASEGAEHVVLLGRRSAMNERHTEAIARMEARGCRVTVKACDVCDRQGLAAIVDELCASDLPLRGVIHAAGVLRDAPLQAQSIRSFTEVMAPKILGAWHLHELTLTSKLDFFVLYSSAVTLVGLAGQANYAAANAFLVQLAHARRELGLPALCVDWGSFGEVGLAADKDVRGERLAARGLPSMKPEDAHGILARALRAGITRVGAQPIRTRQWLEVYPELAARPYLSELLASAAGIPATGDQALLARLLALRPDEARSAMVEHVQKRAADVLRRDPSWIDARAPLSSMGLDSLMGLELRNRLETDLGIRLSATLAWTYPTIDALAGELCRRISSSPSPEPPPRSLDLTQSEAEEGGSAADALGEDELLDYLDRMLEAEAKGPRH